MPKRRKKLDGPVADAAKGGEAERFVLTMSVTTRIIDAKEDDRRIPRPFFQVSDQAKRGPVGEKERFLAAAVPAPERLVGQAQHRMTVRHDPGPFVHLAMSDF